MICRIVITPVQGIAGSVCASSFQICFTILNPPQSTRYGASGTRNRQSASAALCGVWESGALEPLISELITGLVFSASPSGSLQPQYRINGMLTGPQELVGCYIKCLFNFGSCNKRDLLHWLATTFLHWVATTFLHWVATTFLHWVAPTFLHWVAATFLHWVAATFLH